LYTSTAYDATGAPVRQTAAMKSGLWIPAPMPLAPSSTANYSYTSLGQPETVSYGSSNAVNYSYNLRGQVKEIATKGFTQKLWYEDGGTHPCYNGNISRMQVIGVVTDYQYDNLNRLIASTATDGYNTSYRYDLNSAPQSIQRNGMLSDFWSTGLVDDLTMTYDGNRLIKITDDADPVILEESHDFPKVSATLSYDSEGRLYSDSGRDIEKITYAPNDMPMTIFGQHGLIKTQYAYAADGRKLSVAYGNSYTTSITDTRYYVGPIEFVKSSGANSKLTLQRVNLPWGFLDSEGSPFVNLTDYQGNIRAVTRMSDVVDNIDYYPYGLPKASNPGYVSRYKYSGKEFETRGGLDLYDFEARMQLPAAGLFSRPDPKAIKTPGLNTYLYCAANPIMYTDPTGEDVWKINEAGEIVEHIATTYFDKLEFVNSEGKVIVNEEGIEQSLTFEYGTIKHSTGEYSQSSEQYGHISGKYDIFTIKGDLAATPVFEMFSRNVTAKTSNEIGLLRIGSTGKSLNYVTSAHIAHMEPGIPDLFSKKVKEGIYVREVTHSHTNDATPSPGDIGADKQMLKRYRFKNEIRFKIYDSTKDCYNPYDPKTL
ncbi:MAG: RHS repeat-associated core domain-containing protein, partial [Muribaculaceae bacterium]|nr:RHS repeat-associated core domain-containing protein [Muribaculaceae bacterium]